MSNQPTWRCIANLGDVDALTYGGLYLFQDETGVYPPEMERVELLLGDDTPEEILQDDSTEHAYEHHRVVLEPCAWLQDPTTGEHVLSDNPYHPYHASWFADELPAVASCMDYPLTELVSDLCSPDARNRANAWRAILDYHGWDNGDSYPTHHTYRETKTLIKTWDAELSIAERSHQL